jgi:hypothetical protein
MARHSALQSWRTALATGVASAALCAYGVRPARAQTVPPAPPCNQISGTTGSIVTCSGNVSSGVSLPNGSGPFDTLNIGNLTTNIAPASGVTGVEFTSNGNVTLNVDPRPFGIVTTDANGIFAASNGGFVTITSTADITTSGSSSVGIQGSVQSSALTITSTGRISTTGANAFGIAAGSVYGPITITSTSDITTRGTFAAGINAGSIGTLGTTDGAITINSFGNVTTSGNSAIGKRRQRLCADHDQLVRQRVRAGRQLHRHQRSDHRRHHNHLRGQHNVWPRQLERHLRPVPIGQRHDRRDRGYFSRRECGCWNAATLSGTNTVHNFGTITGDVALDGPSVFNNHFGALFNSGQLVQAGVVTNEGTIAPGGRGFIAQTLLSDQFVQTCTGTFAVDINGRSSDQIAVSDTAQLAGKVAVHVLSLCRPPGRCAT